MLEWQPGLPGGAKIEIDGLEIRCGNSGKGAQSVLPPSKHRSGCLYKWIIPPDEAELAPIPAALLDLISKQPPRTQPELDENAVIPEGNRNATLTRMGGAMRAAGLGPDEIEAALLIANRNRCSTPLSDDEVRRIRTQCGKVRIKREPRSNRLLPDYAGQLDVEEPGRRILDRGYPRCQSAHVAGWSGEIVEDITAAGPVPCPSNRIPVLGVVHGAAAT